MENYFVAVEEFDLKSLILYDPESSLEGVDEDYSIHVQEAEFDANSLILFDPESSSEGVDEDYSIHVQEAEFDANSLILFDPESSSEVVEEADVEHASGSGIGPADTYDLIVVEPEDEANEVSSQVVDTVGIDYNGRPKRGRKRKIPSQSRADRKKLCNSNKTHINSKGNVFAEKVFDEHLECMCTRKCGDVVPVDGRRRLFSQFWSMGTYEGRAALLMTCVTQKPAKLPNPNCNARKRESARVYSIYGSIVCQKALLKTLQISDSRLNVALTKYLKSDTLSDLRGQLSGGRNALPLEKTDEVRAHINSFPKYVSHYAREKTESKYLSADLSLAKMYELYKEDAEGPVSQSFYNRIFYTHFNLRFKKPKKDTCHRCDLYLVKKKLSSGAELEMLEEWHEAHIAYGESLQAQMKADCAVAKNDDFLETLTYDMQKTLPLPKLPTSIVYYKRQLNLYNLGIHTGSTGTGKFNLWTEDEASKGTQEVGSCLKLHIEGITKPMKKLILWSDSCGGQNRSIKLVLMIMHILQNHKTLETISLRYLLSGHSFLPNDTEFGEAETAFKRNDRLYTDETYMELMKNCRTRNKFEVNRMLPENFFSVLNLEILITNRKVDLTKQKVSWLDTHEILIEKNQPGVIKMSKKIGGPYQIVNLEKTGCQLDVQHVVLGSLYPTGRTLSKEKVKDLRDMIELFPEEHRQFIVARLNRVQVGDFVDDIDGFGESVDFDVEYSPE